MDYDHLNDKEVVLLILSRNKEVTIDYLYKKSRRTDAVRDGSPARWPSRRRTVRA